MNVECQMSVGQERHQGDVTALLHVADNLQRNEIEFSECIGDLRTKSIFTGAFFGYAILKIHCQQP